MQTSLNKNKTQTKSANRIFHHIIGKTPGSTLVFFAGIHGNENAGVKALDMVLPNIKPEQIRGEIYGVYGNIKALKAKRRFLDSDLNRMWTTERLTALKHKSEYKEEDQEQLELNAFIDKLLSTNSKPIYFIDLHTTSSKTLPFITINDALINRKFSKCFPVPIVLGIEEYLEGPLLSYLNKKGFVSLGFESGQHDDPEAVTNCEAFVHLVLNCSGVLKQPVHKNVSIYEDYLKNTSKGVNETFEVIYKHHIQPEEHFAMEEGFISFQNVEKDTLLAYSNEKPVYSNYNAKLFMPLYQKTGNDGFFIIRAIPPIFLKLSEFLRQIKADSLLTWFPGITWEDKKLGVLKANLKVTRFMAKSIFHLFGYRNKQIDENHMLLYNRERVAKKHLYTKEPWY
ncbi:succinylglutamate desuccinylase/aspartoacylase family protein [uncultured Winogradskyella sp.]|uniref:succinylglutamate desuccinylase/aspartoacylase family protein n=1 Tax=uncultured Winogradskyella sp. TaxID=395353 RepID=UPI00351829A8